MTIQELCDQFHVNLSTYGIKIKYIKIVAAKETGPCYVGKGRTIQEAVDNIQRQIQ